MTRPLVTFGIPFLTAMLAVSFFPLYGTASVIFLLLCALALSAFLAAGERRTLFRVLLLGALAGCSCWVVWQLRTNFDFQSLDGSTVRIRGAVERIEAVSGGTRLALTVEVSAHDIPGAPARFTAIAYVPGETMVDFSDTVDIRGKCFAMSSTPDFNLSDYYRSEGVFLTLSTYRPIGREPPSVKPPGYYARALNRSLCAAVDQLYPQPYSGLVRAILLGDKSAIDSLVYNRFSRAGVIHIFVVSGMHVSLMAGLLFLLLKRLGLSARFQALLGCAAAWGFVAVTGFGLPAVRSGVMITVMLAGTLFRRPSDALNSLFLAGILITAFSPSAIVSGSFQLSMSATLGVILFTRPITGWILRRTGFTGKYGNAFANLLACSLAANVGMFPFILRLFHGISLVFPLSNLLSVPLLPVLLVLAALSLAALPFPPLARAVARLTEGVLWLVMKVSETVANPHPFYLGLNYPVVGVWLLAGGAALLPAILRRKKALAVRTAGFLALLLAGTLGLQAFLNRDTVAVTPVYSFSGVSVVIQRGREATVVALADDGNVDQTVEAFLRSRNVWTVDNLVLAYGEPAELGDTAFLARTIKLGRLYAVEAGDFRPYAEDALHPLAGSFPLRDGHGYDIASLPGGGLMEVYHENGETIVNVTLGDTRLSITDSAALAAKADCEILIWAGKNLQKIQQIPLKYVILLNKPEPVPEELPTGVWPAYQRTGTLYLDVAGSFRME